MCGVVPTEPYEPIQGIVLPIATVAIVYGAPPLRFNIQEDSVGGPWRFVEWRKYEYLQPLNFMEFHLGLGTDQIRSDQIRPDKINGIICTWVAKDRGDRSDNRYDNFLACHRYAYTPLSDLICRYLQVSPKNNWHWLKPPRSCLLLQYFSLNVLFLHIKS